MKYISLKILSLYLYICIHFKAKDMPYQIDFAKITKQKKIKIKQKNIEVLSNFQCNQTSYISFLLLFRFHSSF